METPRSVEEEVLQMLEPGFLCRLWQDHSEAAVPPHSMGEAEMPLQPVGEMPMPEQADALRRPWSSRKPMERQVLLPSWNSLSLNDCTLCKSNPCSPKTSVLGAWFASGRDSHCSSFWRTTAQEIGAMLRNEWRSVSHRKDPTVPLRNNVSPCGAEENLG